MTIESDSRPLPGADMLTIREAMALVGVSRRTIYNWLHAGKLQFVRTAGGSVRIYTASLFRTESK